GGSECDRGHVGRLVWCRMIEIRKLRWRVYSPFNHIMGHENLCQSQGKLSTSNRSSKTSVALAALQPETNSKQINCRSSRLRRLTESTAGSLPNCSDSMTTWSTSALSALDSFQFSCAALSLACKARPIGWPRKLIDNFALSRSTLRRRIASLISSLTVC